MDRMKKIANSIGKIVKSLGIKVFQELRREIIQKWNEKEPKEHYFQLGKLSIIALIMILVYTSFFAMEKTAEESPVLVEEPKVPDMLRIVETGEITNLNSVYAINASELNIINNIMEGLVRLDQNNKPINAGAENIEISPDKKIYKIRLNPKVRWSDGSSVKASDYTFAWYKIIDVKTNSINSPLFKNIKYVSEYRNGKRELNDIGIQEINDYTIKITLEKPDLNFITLLANTAYFPVKKDLYEKTNKSYATSIENIACNGPFKLTKFELDYVLAIKNEHYFDNKSIKLKGFSVKNLNNRDKIINFYKSGEVDIVNNIEGDKADIKTNSAVSYFIKVNNSKLLLEEIRFLSSVLSPLKSDKIESVFPISFLIPDVINKGRVNTVHQKNNSLSTKSLRELKIISIDNGVLKLASNNLATELKKNHNIEVQVDLKNSYADLRKAEREGDYDLSLTSWLADYHDPLTFLDIFTTNAVENTSGYSNPKFDQLVAQAHEEIDPEKQAKLIAEAENILVNEDMAVIPLYQKVIPRLQKPYVQGVVYHPYGAEYSLKWAQIKEIK